jgi:hypothetical protein
VSYLSCDLSYFNGLLPVKAKARKLLDEATKIERGKAMLEQHRLHRDADRRADQEFLRRYDPERLAKKIEDDEVRGGSPLEGIPLPDLVPDRWTVEWVAARLIRAWEHVEWGRVAPGSKSGLWPEYWHSWADMMGWDAGEFRARPLEQWARQRPALSAHELRLNGEAEGWALRYLAGHEREARALQIWLGSKVTGRVKVPREVAKQGWSRSMYSRARRDALEMIAAGLRADGVPVA